MIFKNLARRKGRTFLTTFGIAIGVAAIIGLGALADGLNTGYDQMVSGAKADLVLSQKDAFDISYSSIEDAVESELRNMPEVLDTSSMIEGFVQSEELPLFFVFGYPEDSFVLPRFKIVDGVSLDSREARRARGTPLILGLTASEILSKSVGDTVYLGNSAFRVVGIYETGETFEDSGAVIGLEDAQILLGKSRQVSIIYIKLKDPTQRDRLSERAARLWNDLDISGTEEFANKQMMGDFMGIFAWVIAGMAIVIGGVGMMNAQLMAVMERTREIGVLRAVGWRRVRIMRMILGESVLVGLAGAVFGTFLGWTFLKTAADVAAIFGSTSGNIRPGLLGQALLTVLVLGVIGGLYPAWRASRMQPIEALRYEGGSSGSKVRRLPFGGLAVQGLWQRGSRTFLTLGAIGLTVGTIIALESAVKGALVLMTDIMGSGSSEVIIRQADVADTSLSSVDEAVFDRIAALPTVRAVSPMMMAVSSMEELPFFLIQGYPPNSLAVLRFVPVEGTTITGNRQVMLGKTAAEALKRSVGDNVEISGSRFKVVGIYETGVSYEEFGGLMSLRDAQILAGRPRKATIVSIKLENPRDADDVVRQINLEFPEVHAAVTGDFVAQMPDIKNMDLMMNSITVLAVAVGGVSVMNTMLMSVLERTREIGVLRALGWGKRRILGLILQESLLLGTIGGIAGIVIAQLIAFWLDRLPVLNNSFAPIISFETLYKAVVVAITLGVVGGLYPAYRATRMAPVEALRYE